MKQNKVKNFWQLIKRFLRMKGTWEWACDQMMEGKIVRPKNASGCVHYKLDNATNKRIIWNFTKEEGNFGSHWDSANIFIRDFESTDWVEWKPDSF